MKMYFITNPVGFIPESYFKEGAYGDVVAIEPTDDELQEYRKAYPQGKTLGVIDGRPAWVDLPLPTQEEIIATAERKKKDLLSDADTITADWRTELALGIIDDDDKAKLTAWMKYIKAAKEVDTSTAPDVSWPIRPA